MNESDDKPKRDAIQRRVAEIAEFLRRQQPPWHQCPATEDFKDGFQATTKWGIKAVQIAGPDDECLALGGEFVVTDGCKEFRSDSHDDAAWLCDLLNLYQGSDC